MRVAVTGRKEGRKVDINKRESLARRSVGWRGEEERSGLDIGEGKDARSRPEFNAILVVEKLDSHSSAKMT